MTKPVSFDPPASWQDAGVLVPVYRDDSGDLRVVVVRRTERGIHGGQLAFPGGKREPDDGSLAETALREAHEETGIVPRKTEMLAPLPTVDTVVSGYRIHPFLGRIVPPEEWRPQPEEIEEVIVTRLSDFLDPGAHAVETWQLDGWPRPLRIGFYRVGPHKLWGATYRILHELLPRLLKPEWDV